MKACKYRFSQKSPEPEKPKLTAIMFSFLVKMHKNEYLQNFIHIVACIQNFLQHRYC